MCAAASQAALRNLSFVHEKIRTKMKKKNEKKQEQEQGRKKKERNSPSLKLSFIFITLVAFIVVRPRREVRVFECTDPSSKRTPAFTGL